MELFLSLFVEVEIVLVEEMVSYFFGVQFLFDGFLVLENFLEVVILKVLDFMERNRDNVFENLIIVEISDSFVDDSMIGFSL